MNVEQVFKKHVQSVYAQEAQEQKYEDQRTEFIKDFDVSSSRVHEEILKSHGCLNLVNSSNFDLIKKQLWRIQSDFDEHIPATQGCIIHYYMPNSW